MLCWCAHEDHHLTSAIRSQPLASRAGSIVASSASSHDSTPRGPQSLMPCPALAVRLPAGVTGVMWGTMLFLIAITQGGGDAFIYFQF